MTARPRVLYSFPHVLGRPGIATTAEQQVRALHALGCPVEVWCAASATSLPDGVRVVETLRLGRVRLPHRAVGVDRAYRLHDRLVAGALRRRAADVDVVHTWPLGALSTLRAAAEVRVVGVREVPNTHTAEAVDEVAREYALLGLEPPLRHSHTRDDRRIAREEAEYAAAAGLLLPSEHVAASFVTRRRAPQQLLRHHYGYDPEVFFPLGRDRAGGQGPLSAVYAGSCEPRKGLHYALRAWHDSGAASTGVLRVCGRFSPGYAALLRPMTEHPSVVLLDFCSDLGAVLRDADVLLLPSVEEGSALVTYEAMASGCVPLVSTAAGAPVRHGVDGLLHQPRDVVTLTAQLGQLLRDPPRLAGLRAAALTSSAGLTWRAAGRRLLDAYATAGCGVRPSPEGARAPA